MAFFSKFPKVSYDFNRTGTIDQMVNIFRSVRSRTTSLNKSTLYKNYVIEDGMRPDIISEKLYGTPDYYWTFFIINDFLHDGLQAWPMSESALQEYMKNNYSGKVLCFTPFVIEDPADGSRILTKNSIAGKLDLGALVYGITSGAVGRIKRKDIDLNCIVLENVINGVAGRNPITGQNDPNIQGGGFSTSEFIQSTYTLDSGAEITLDAGDGVSESNSSRNSLTPDHIYDYAEAPSYYYINDDPDERPITSPTVIPPEFNQTTAVYSELQWNRNLQTQVLQPLYDESILNQPLVGDAGDGWIATNTSIAKPLIYSGGYQITSDDLAGDVTFKSNRQFIREQNEKRSFIRVINPNSISEFVEEFENLINA